MERSDLSMKRRTALSLDDLSVESKRLSHLYEVVVHGLSIGGRTGVVLTAGSSGCCNRNGHSMDTDLSPAVAAPILVLRPEVDAERHSSRIGDAELEFFIVLRLKDHPTRAIQSNTG